MDPKAFVLINGGGVIAALVIIFGRKPLKALFTPSPAYRAAKERRFERRLARRLCRSPKGERVAPGVTWRLPNSDAVIYYGYDLHRRFHYLAAFPFSVLDQNYGVLLVRSYWWLPAWWDAGRFRKHYRRWSRASRIGVIRLARKRKQDWRWLQRPVYAGRH